MSNLFFILFIIFFGIFFYKLFLFFINKYTLKVFIDNQLNKPQAFHATPTPAIGGSGIFFSLLIAILYFYLYKNIFFFEYLSFCLLFFLIGFTDDIKINFNSNIRLLLMIISLILLVKFNNFYITYTGIEFLNNLIKHFNFFSLFFVCLCFLFIVNGANLIDGYNGLLGIHSLIIFLNLFFVNYIYGNSELAFFILGIIFILITFLIFNFPKAQIFLGDSGAYFLGVVLSISAIKTSIAIPEISPFYFCILLFYLFFEVFFSFFRKIFKEKKSPIHPDKKHLHMLIYKFFLKRNGNKVKSNYYVSIVINLFYFILIFPVIFMKDNGMFCKYYSILLFIFYLYTYKLVHGKTK